MQAISTTLDGAMDYAERGWRVVPLHGVRDGVCTCPRGKNCGSAGKHPRLKAWQSQATIDTDVITDWWQRWPESNVGVVLGQSSGFVDIECDSPEAEQALADLFAGEFPPIPKFQASRGVHRLFGWSEDLLEIPGAEKAVFKWKDIEFRFGGGDKGAQSVFPPSMHHSGKAYHWLQHPDESELVPLPARIVALLRNRDKAPTPAHTPSADTNGVSKVGKENLEAAGFTEDKRSEWHKLYEQDRVLETVDGRDNVIYAEACRQWWEQVKVAGSGCVDDHIFQARVYERIWCMNCVKCEPPLDAAIVQQKCESARKFIRQQSRDNEGKSLTAIGLDLKPDGWWPGQWRICCVKSNPMEVKLWTPFLGDRYIRMPHRDFLDAEIVNAEILNATGNICLDQKPGYWRKIWNGTAATKSSDGTVGLRVRLLEACTFEEAPLEQKRPLIVAQYLWNSLSVAHPQDDEKIQHMMGCPVKDYKGNVYFSFEYIWELAASSPDKIKRNEFSQLLKELGVKNYVPRSHGTRKRLKFLPPEGMTMLADMLEISELPDSPMENGDEQ